MHIDKYVYKHFDYINGYGYPFLLLTFTAQKEGANYKLEVFELFINYNVNNNTERWDYRKIDVDELIIRENYSEDQLLKFGMEVAENFLTNKIDQSGNDLSIMGLPLKERELSLDAFMYLRTCKDFEAIKAYLSKSVSYTLKNKIDNLEAFKFQL